MEKIFGDGGQIIWKFKLNCEMSKMNDKDKFIGVWLNPIDNSLKGQVGRTNENINILAVNIIKQ